MEEGMIFRGFSVCMCIALLHAGSAHEVGHEDESERTSTFRQCIEKCVSKNYAGPTPSTRCAFSRSANYKQSWNGPPVKVSAPSPQPVYGQRALFDERLPAGDVRKRSTHLYRVLRGILRDKRTSSSSVSDYVRVCYNCIAETCRFAFFFG
ncbi:uncharacterized protein LOC134275747 [Saccostrea cucullata]|uniref:uncharacterized protein LOC134275747 n=1 Tax=Saccostrea cuccullata TaxID=36930 RepID=UPI002ED62D66